MQEKLCWQVPRTAAGFLSALATRATTSGCLCCSCLAMRAHSRWPRREEAECQICRPPASSQEIIFANADENTGQDVLLARFVAVRIISAISGERCFWTYFAAQPLTRFTARQTQWLQRISWNSREAARKSGNRAGTSGNKFANGQQSCWKFTFQFVVIYPLHVYEVANDAWSGFGSSCSPSVYQL